MTKAGYRGKNLTRDLLTISEGFTINIIAKSIAVGSKLWLGSSI